MSDVVPHLVIYRQDLRLRIEMNTAPNRLRLTLRVLTEASITLSTQSSPQTTLLLLRSHQQNSPSPLSIPHLTHRHPVTSPASPPTCLDSRTSLTRAARNQKSKHQAVQTMLVRKAPATRRPVVRLHSTTVRRTMATVTRWISMHQLTRTHLSPTKHARP